MNCYNIDAVLTDNLWLNKIWCHLGIAVKGLMFVRPVFTADVPVFVYM